MDSGSFLGGLRLFFAYLLLAGTTSGEKEVEEARQWCGMGCMGPL